MSSSSQTSAQAWTLAFLLQSGLQNVNKHSTIWELNARWKLTRKITTSTHSIKKKLSGAVRDLVHNWCSNMRSTRPYLHHLCISSWSGSKLCTSAHTLHVKRPTIRDSRTSPGETGRSMLCQTRWKVICFPLTHMSAMQMTPSLKILGG